MEGAGKGRRLASRSVCASGGVGAGGAGAGAGRAAAGRFGTSTPREETGRSARRSMHGVVGTTSRSWLPLFMHSMVEVPRLHAPRHTQISSGHGRMVSTLYLEREGERATLLFDYFSITACAYMCVRCFLYQRYFIIPHSGFRIRPKQQSLCGLHTSGHTAALSSRVQNI